MKASDVTLGILAAGGIALLGFFSPPVFEDGKLVLVPDYTVSDTQNINGAVAGRVSDMSMCVNAKSMTKGLASLERQTTQGCSDIGIVSSLVEDKLTTLDRTVTYRTTVTNYGPDDVTSIRIKNNIPDEFVSVDWSGDIAKNSYIPSLDIYHIPALKVGETTFVDFTVEITPVSCGFVHDNTTHLDSFAGSDYFLENNYSVSRMVIPTCPKWDQVYSL